MPYLWNGWGKEDGIWLAYKVCYVEQTIIKIILIKRCVDEKNEVLRVSQGGIGM